MKSALLGLILGVLVAVPAWASTAKKFFTEERGFWSVRDRNDTDWPAPEAGARSHIMVARIHDDEKNVTCWVASGSMRGGISCIPDKDLR